MELHDQRFDQLRVLHWGSWQLLFRWNVKLGRGPSAVWSISPIGLVFRDGGRLVPSLKDSDSSELL